MTRGICYRRKNKTEFVQWVKYFLRWEKGDLTMLRKVNDGRMD